MSDGNTALALALGAGAGLGLWYLLGRDEGRDVEPEQDQADAAATTMTSAPTAASTSSPGATAPAPSTRPVAPSKPCALWLDINGITSEGVPLTVSGAVARCKPAARAELTIASNAPSAVYADLVAAFRTAGIALGERRNARVRGRGKPGDTSIATFRALAARVRAAAATRQGSKRPEAAVKLARFVARHSGAEVEDQATVDFEDNVVVSGAPREMRKVAAWVERLARDSGRVVSATVETFDDPEDPDWAVCRIHGLVVGGS